MKKTFYTYEEALTLIKSKIASSTKTKHKKLEYGDIREFCQTNNLEYFSILNCLNSKTESRPKLVKELLDIVMSSNKIIHKKQNIYFIEEI